MVHYRSRKEILNMLKANYDFKICDAKVIVTNKNGKTIKPLIYKQKPIRYIMWISGHRYEFPEKEIISIMQGKKYVKRTYNNSFKYICTICKLDYPADEMRGPQKNICYLCLEETKNVKRAN